LATDSSVKKKILIIGLPNSGKSQIFNNLTGEYSVVANYPQTTVEIRRSRRELAGEPCEIIDTPGIQGLYTQSRDEVTVRDLIFSEKPHLIIQCLDANRLKQALPLTADLLELGIPFIVALNGIDGTSRAGIWIDSRRLSRLLRVQVVETIAQNGKGTAELLEAIDKARPVSLRAPYPAGVEEGISCIRSMLPDGLSFDRKIALLLLMKDPFIAQYLEKTYSDIDVASLMNKVESIQRGFMGNISMAVSRKQSRWVDGIARDVVQKQIVAHNDLPQKVACFISQPLTGIPVLLMVVYAMFFLIVNVANEITELMDAFLWQPVEHWIGGMVPAGFIHDLLIGEYGVLSLGVANALLTVLPILSVFYLFFNLLEDVGYIANLSIMTKRLLEKFGLSGNAIMPLVLGFGCKTMATLTTRSLASKKERCIAIYLIAFAIPCAAQTGINMSILGRMGLMAFIITFAVLIMAEVIAGVALNKILRGDPKSDFIHELPAIQLPSMKGTFKKTYYRLVWFLKEALPVFVYASLLLFLFDRLGILNELRLLLKPVIEKVLGLPLAMVDAMILCMVRREAAAGMIINLIKSGHLTYVQCIVAVIVTTMFVPCFANTMSMIRELGGKKALMMVGAINMSSFAIGGILNWTLMALIKI